MEYPKPTTKIIDPYRRGREIRVKIEGETPTSRKPEAEIPYGTVLPRYYYIFTADISKTEGTVLMLYFEDTGVITSNASHQNSDQLWKSSKNDL